MAHSWLVAVSDNVFKTLNYVFFVMLPEVCTFGLFGLVYANNMLFQLSVRLLRDVEHVSLEQAEEMFEKESVDI